jgi:hypothetical protein
VTWVYFIKPIGLQGPIKIGCSKSPEGRHSTLESWSPFALEIIATIEGDFDLERRFHAAFIETHDRREWFGWSRSLQNTIDQIAAGTFDVSTLPAPKAVASLRRGKRREWTPEQRLRASLGSQVRSIKNKLGYMPLHAVEVYQVGEPGFEHMQKLVEDFIADPIKHGITFADWCARYKETRVAYHSAEAEKHKRIAAQ